MNLIEQTSTVRGVDVEQVNAAIPKHEVMD